MRGIVSDSSLSTGGASPHAVNDAKWLTEEDSEALAPSPRDRRERNSPMSLEMAERLWRLRDPIATKIADAIHTCATNESGLRCGSQLCPRCSRRASVRLRRTVERRLLSVPSGYVLDLVTLTLPAMDLGAGRDVLVQEFARFRRTRHWKSAGYVAGVVGVEFGPSSTGGWHVHLHALCIRPASMRCRRRGLARAWRQACSVDGRFGRLHVQPIHQWFAPGGAHRGGGHFQSSGVLRMQASTKDLALARRRPTLGDRARRPSSAVVPAVRPVARRERRIARRTRRAFTRVKARPS